MFVALLSAALCTTSITCALQSSTTSSGNYVIVGCTFSCFSSSSSGGAVSVSSSSSTIVVNNTIFIASYSSSNGGGLYFSGTSSTMYSVCGSNCMSSASTWVQGGQLFYSAATSSHAISFLSVFQCSNSSSVGYYGAFFANSATNMNANAINSSYNYISKMGSCCVFHSNTYPSVAFSNFYNCTAGAARMIYYDYPTLGWLNSSNVIRNALSDFTLGVIYAYNTAGSVYVYGCVFAGNTGALFGADNPITLLAYNCWIDHSGYSICTSNAKTSACYTVTTNTLTYSNYGFFFGTTYCSVPLKSSPNFTNGFAYIAFPVVSLVFVQLLSTD